MSWQTQLRGDSVSWLLESDSPGVRYLALRDLMEFPAEDARAVMKLAKEYERVQNEMDSLLAEWEGVQG